ncbi:MAG: protealysin inhibitor emfourin [Candidatus Binatia bacterium]
MKVRYRQSGGFGGLVLGSDLDTQTLPPGEADELERLVKQADLDQAGVKKSARGRDLTNYEIIIEHAGRTTKASLDDMTVPANVQPLLDFLNRRVSAKPLDD